MSSSRNIEMQIEDIDNKIQRLQTQKQLLLDRLKRKEQHSNRIKQQNEEAQKSEDIGLKTNGLETGFQSSRSFT